METLTTLVIVLVVLAVIAAVVFFVLKAQKRKALQQRFGPEYDRAVEDGDDRRGAERELKQRADRRDELDIKPLDPASRDRYAADWRGTQERFVDEPSQAVQEADALVTRVMEQRGYPVGDFDQMARDVSVDHAPVVEEYRSAHDISQLNDREQATTEQLRQAMVHFRSLFADLLDAGDHDRPRDDRSRDRDRSRDDDRSRGDDRPRDDDRSRGDERPRDDDLSRGDDRPRDDDRPTGRHSTDDRDRT